LAADKVFVDASVLVQAHNLDGGEKRAIAEHVLRQIWIDECGVVSVPVLEDLYLALTSGIASPVPRRAARDLVQAYSVWPTMTIDAADVIAASEFEERYRITLREALVVVAARKSSATLVLSEMNPHRPIAGLDVRNPFA
jgi:predicted nucleic acid-binding protein